MRNDLMTTPAAVPATDTPCFSRDPVERVELTALFDSTDMLDHLDARLACVKACPFLDGCRRLARDLAATEQWAGVPAGTWGGELYVKGRRKA